MLELIVGIVALVEAGIGDRLERRTQDREQYEIDRPGRQQNAEDQLEDLENGSSRGGRARPAAA